jgi:DNA-binding GntR family transcriptional regulator
VYTGPSRGDTAYAELKRRLLQGEFPLGERLAETRLASLLDVSRTPVREALARLHAEDLVERHHDGGFQPSPPDLHRTHELYQIRIALELHAICSPAGEAHDASIIAPLHREWAELSDAADVPVDPGFVLLDEDFHVRLASAAGNSALVEVLVGINERIRPVRMHDFLSEERVDATIREHLGILDALLAFDRTTAADRLRRHLLQSLEVVEGRAATALARMVRSGHADHRAALTERAEPAPDVSR